MQKKVEATLRYPWLYICVCVWVYACSQSSPTLCTPMNCSLPVSSDHWIFQARILKQVAIFYSRGSSRFRGQTFISCVSCIGRCSTLRHLGSLYRCVCVCVCVYIYIYIYIYECSFSITKLWAISDWELWVQGLTIDMNLGFLTNQ